MLNYIGDWRDPAPQKAIDRIRATITQDTSSSNPRAVQCECVHISDVSVSFPDGSLKRPDIAIFCEEPREEDEAITLLPQAVIEIVNKGYEAKDPEIGPHCYQSQGVKDVVVFDPYTLLVLHVRRDGTIRQVSPVDIVLECGYKCTV